jgi:hypothetical protein
MVRDPMPSDELEKISDAVEMWKQSPSGRVLNAVETAIRYEFENVQDSVSNIVSELTLGDHATTLEKLAKRAGVTDETVQRAIECVNDRKAWLEEQTSELESPSVTRPTPRDGDSFDDKELRDLFAPLLQRE